MPANKVIAVLSVVVVALTAAVFAGLAWWSAKSNSATYDEPLHLVAAQLIATESDCRYNSEDPALWHRWASLPLASDSLATYLDTPMRRDAVEDNYVRWAFVSSSLFLGKDAAGQRIDGHSILMQSRAMMLSVGVALVVAAAFLAGRLAGGPQASAIAAVVAAALLAFDPLLLGHGALVKNDIFMSLVFVLAIAAVLALGRTLTPGRIAAVLLTVAIAPCIKFSGLLIGPIIAVLLFLRCLIGGNWRFNLWGREGEISRIVPKLGVATGMMLAAVLASWMVIWVTYGFRYAPSAAGELDIAKQVAAVRYAVAFEQIGTRLPTPEEAQAAKLPVVPGLIAQLDEHKLLPQAWSHGFLFTYHTSKSRVSYLLGSVSNFGWWYYFPLTLVFKMPVASLALWGFAVVASCYAVLKRRGGLPWWEIACIGLPVLAYLLSAIGTNMNIGMRHVMPVVVLGHVMAAAVVGASVAGSAGTLRKLVVVSISLLLVLAATEVLRAGPQFLPFFNTPAQAVGPERLLGDSNLDWGQDLIRLAEWQEREAAGEYGGRRMFLAYFGSAVPSRYGVSATMLPGSSMMLPNENPDFRQIIGSEPAVIAVSTTILQGIYTPEQVHKFYLRVAQLPMIGKVGSSIYLYDYSTGARAPRPVQP